MFFERYGDTQISDTAAQERLAAKVATPLHTTKDPLATPLPPSPVSIEHPEKRRKTEKKKKLFPDEEHEDVIGCEKMRKKKRRKETEEIVPEVTGKKKKSKKTVAEEESVSELETVAANGTDVVKKKKKKKRDRTSEEIIKEKLAQVVAEESEVLAETETTEKKKKKKTKEEKTGYDFPDVEKETDNDNEEVLGEGSEAVLAEEEIVQVEEEWTVLGKKKRKDKLKAVKRDLPDWILYGEVINTDFDDSVPLEEVLCLDECVKEHLVKMDIASLFPIQSTIVPSVVAGSVGCGMVTVSGTPPSDLCVSAPTGSGKTLVYVLPLVQVLYKLPPMLQALIVVPTKNLANQVRQVLIKFDKLVNVALLSGKDTFPTEQKHLFSPQGRCLAHIAVTTPGRLVNHLRDTPLFNLQHLRFLVIDEMDTLLNQSYQDWIPALFSTVYNIQPTGHPLQPNYLTTRQPPLTTLSTADLFSTALPLQKMLFSATLTHDPGKLGPLQLYQPKLFSCGGKYNIPSTLEQWQIRCTASDKPMVVLHLVKELKRVLCFSSSVDTTHRLAVLADEFGSVRVKEYSSTLSQQERNRVVRDFNAGLIDLLVCSDSLARGMDLPSVDHVVNYDVPAHVQTYVHRVGRTARAGRAGHAYTLIKHEETRHFHQLLKKAGDSQVKDYSIAQSALEEMTEHYQKSLDSLKTRLKNKKK